MSWEIVSKQVNIFTYIGVRKVAVGFCCAQQRERKTHLGDAWDRFGERVTNPYKTLH